MSKSQQDFAAAHYGPRAADYVTSVVHAAGPDLDRMEALLRGRGAGAVLDLGCGGGHVSYRAAPHAARVVAVDVTAEMLAQVRAQAKAKGLVNIETCQAAAETLPFDDAGFDVVLSRFSAHHWQDFRAGLREARRVLKPGGTAVFIDTLGPAEPGLDTFLQAVELMRDPSHVRNYSLAEWSAALGTAGFGVREVHTHNLPLGFETWVARTRTPDVMVAAIRAMQQGAPEAARTRFSIAPDGGFEIEVGSFQAVAV